MGEKLTVIGSNSFSGTHFVDYALKQDLDVIGISRSAEPHSVFCHIKIERMLTSGFSSAI